MVNARILDKKGEENKVQLMLLVPALILMGLGLMMVLSSSGIMAEKTMQDKYYFFKKQAVFVVLGLVAIYLSSKVPIKLIYKTVYLWLFAALAMLGSTLGPWGVEAGGAKRWLDLGIFYVQPLEVAKLSLVLYLAYFYSNKKDKIKTFSVGFLPPVVITAVLAGLLLWQPDFGGAVFICGVFFLISLVGGARLKYLISSMLLTAGAGYLMILDSPYRLKRWLAFLNPFQNAQDAGYQVVQSLYALGSGQVFGQGLGAGKQKLFFLPEAHTDFIVAVLGEELGFVGMSTVFLCLGSILLGCLLICLHQKDLQGRYTALGLSLIFLLGAFLNLAVVMGTVPPKGLPMPFISYGGSNFLIMSICIGLLLNLGRTGAKGG